MADTILDIDIAQGSDLDVEFDWKNPITLLPVDLTDYDAIMQIRPRPGDPTLLAEFSTARGNIILKADGLPGVIRVLIRPSDTRYGAWYDGFYDLYLINRVTSKTTRQSMGQVTVTLSTTLNPNFPIYPSPGSGNIGGNPPA
jgi:hypothetical protein